MTPAVSPKPTARTKDQRHNQFRDTAQEYERPAQAGAHCRRDDAHRPTTRREMDSVRLARSDSGMASPSASTMPLVAMATVFPRRSAPAAA